MRNLRDVLAIARAQHGVVSRAQLVRLGVSASAILNLVEAGILVRRSRAVYVVPASAATFKQRAMEGVFAAGYPGAPGEDDEEPSEGAEPVSNDEHDGDGESEPALVGACRRSAAHLLGLEDRLEPATVQVVVAHARVPRLENLSVHVHRSRTLRAEDLAIVDGVPTTSGSRTSADLAITHPLDYVLDITAKALQRDLATLGGLSDQFVRAGRIPGAPKLRVALARLAGDTHLGESPPEERVFQVLVAAGLPPPVRQYVLVDADGNRRRLDLAYPQWKIAIEVDGYWWHSRPGAKQRDDIRRNALTNGRWHPLHFSPGHSDAYIATTVAKAIDDRR